MEKRVTDVYVCLRVYESVEHKNNTHYVVCAVEKNHDGFTIKDTSLAVFDSTNNAKAPPMGSIVILRSFFFEGQVKLYTAHASNIKPKFNFFQSLLESRITDIVKLDECANTQQIRDLFFNRPNGVSVDVQVLLDINGLFK